jgi:hypothetical protein
MRRRLSERLFDAGSRLAPSVADHADSDEASPARPVTRPGGQAPGAGTAVSTSESLSAAGRKLSAAGAAASSTGHPQDGLRVGPPAPAAAQQAGTGAVAKQLPRLRPQLSFGLAGLNNAPANNGAPAAAGSPGTAAGGAVATSPSATAAAAAAARAAAAAAAAARGSGEREAGMWGSASAGAAAALRFVVRPLPALLWGRPAAKQADAW